MLDSGPLGRLTNADYSRNRDIRRWLATLLDQDVPVFLPEIARSRKTGRSVGDPKELNADVILAAQAIRLGATIATDNIGHLAQFAEARPWAAIKP